MPLQLTHAFSRARTPWTWQHEAAGTQGLGAFNQYAARFRSYEGGVGSSSGSGTTVA